MTLKRRKPLRNRKPMSRTSALNSRSSKTEQRDDARRDLVELWLGNAALENPLGCWPRCEVRLDRRCTGVATHAHEPLMRSRGGDVLDRSQCLLTCWPCHRGVHTATGELLEQVYARGLLVHSWTA